MKVNVTTYPGRTLNIEGETYLYFGGTSYLGIQLNTEFNEMVRRSLEQFGSNYGASRRSNVQFGIYEEAETYLAKWVGSEAALSMSSGYLSGQLIAQHFSTKEYRLFYAPNSHSALYTSSARPYTTYTTLNIALRQHLDNQNPETPVVFLDSIDFSGCNYPNFEILRTLPLDSCILVVDDSHGIGVVGQNGAGVYQTLLSIPCRELIVCASLGKALGIQAGAVWGTGSRITVMKTSGFFGGASPAAPFYLSHFIKANSIYEKQREILQQNITFFLSLIKEITFLNYMPQYPVFGYSNPKLTDHLTKCHIIVTDFRYPTEDTYAANRIVLTAAHTQEDIRTLAEALNSFK